jgi:alginate O-acetyltransferase complex protein AlgI
MLFNSFVFLVLFLPVVLLGYYSLGHKNQNRFLVVASCVFYASWDWRFLLPLLATTSIDFYIARRLQSLSITPDNLGTRKRLVVISIVSNLVLLGFFKYFNFFAQSLVELLEVGGFEVRVEVIEIVLPVAISFYTFQAMSYTIDVYRGKFHAKEGFWDFFLAVLYFPHLVAGPIQRAASLIPQVVNPRVITKDKVMEGLHLIVWGMFKKVFIADNLSPIADSVFGNPGASGGEVLVGVLAFTIQIYCDFSGYTDIARGLAKIMGFEFQLNFNLPYFARNPSDFWKRWHISLSEWLRDYLYKPLGGNRDGTYLTYRNLLLTMLLGGLWHGAAWNFVLWGAYHGMILILHRLMLGPLVVMEGAIRLPKWIWHWVCVLGMFVLTLYGWLLFRATSVGQIVDMTLQLLSPLEGFPLSDFQTIAGYTSPLILVQIYQYRKGDLWFLRNSALSVRIMAYCLMLYLMTVYGGVSQSFVYFQF